MAYEDVIPQSYYNAGSSDDVKSYLLSLPITSFDRITAFISWSKDIGYKFTKKDLDVFRH